MFGLEAVALATQALMMLPKRGAPPPPANASAMGKRSVPVIPYFKRDSNFVYHEFVPSRKSKDSLRKLVGSSFGAWSAVCARE